MRSTNFSTGTQALLKLVMGVMLLASASIVNALPSGFDGTLVIQGLASVDSSFGATGEMEDATSLSFSALSVASASGVYAADGLPGSASALSFGALTSIGLTASDPWTAADPFWSVTGTAFTWTFSLDSLTSITRVDTGVGTGFLNIQGTGVASSTDVTLTPQDGIWSLTLTDSGAAISFTSNTEVPEPTTLALMGLGILGLGALRRRSRV